MNYLKQVLLLCLAILVGVAGFTQTVTWAENHVLRNADWAEKYLDENYNYLITQSYYRYSTTGGTNDTYINVYSKPELKLIYTKELARRRESNDLYEEGKIGYSNTLIKKIAVLDERVVIFFYNLNEVEKTRSLETIQFDAKTGKILQEKTNLLSIPKNKGESWGDCEINILNHHGKKSVTIRFSNEVVDYLLLFDSKLNKICEKEDKSKDALNSGSKYSFQIDKEGSYYYLKKNEESNKHYVVSFDANKNYERWEEELDMSGVPNGTLYNFESVTTKDNDLIIFGMFTTLTPNQLSSTPLIFFDKLRENGKIEVGHFYIRIDGKSKELETVATQIHKHSLSGKRNVEAFPTLDGQVLFIVEKWDREGKRRDDLTLIKIGSDGKILWESTVNKKHKYPQWNHSSGGFDYYKYFICETKAGCVVIFNSSAKNSEYTLPEKLTAYLHRKESNLCISYVDIKTGNVMQKYTNVANVEKYGLLVKRFAQDAQDNSIYINAVNGKNSRNGILMLE